ncbi:CotS family spore coat protein [Paenibacillus filicis]
MTLITSKPDKGGAIWKIDTNHGPRSLKVLHRGPARSLFSIGAQDYLVQQGARVPALLPNKDGQHYTEAGGKLWIVTEWVEPLVPVSKVDLEGAAELCKGLGEFHKKSQGYEPPFGAARSSRLYRWPKYYEKIIAKIGWFRDICHLYNEYPASASLLAVVDQFEQQARDIYERFQQSPYYRMTGVGEAHFGLAHQDYGWSNGQMGPGGIWVIDLDGVAYDLPVRDLRKLMTSTMDDMGSWDLTWLRGMIAAYHEGNPLDRETFEILWLDMAFPNEFYKHVKEIVFEPEIFLQTDLANILQRVLTVESTKWEVLQELEHDKENYAPGNYSELAERKPSWTERVLDYDNLAAPGAFDGLLKERPISLPSENYSISPEKVDAFTPDDDIFDHSLIAEEVLQVPQAEQEHEPPYADQVQEEPFAEHVREDSFAEHVHEESFAEHVREDSFAEHVHEESFAEHVHEESFAEHVHEESFAEYVQEESFAEYVQEESFAEHVHEVPYAEHVHLVPYTEHVHEVPYAEHVHQVSYAEHVHQVPYAEHVHQVPYTEHVHEVPYAEHVHQVSYAEHVHEVPYAEHVHEVSYAEHVHEVPYAELIQEGQHAAWSEPALQLPVHSSAEQFSVLPQEQLVHHVQQVQSAESVQRPTEVPIVVHLPIAAAPVPSRRPRRRRKKIIRIAKPLSAKSNKRSKVNKKRKSGAKRNVISKLQRKTKTTKIVKRSTRSIHSGNKSRTASKVKVVSRPIAATTSAPLNLRNHASRLKTSAGKTKLKQRKRTA